MKKMIFSCCAVLTLAALNAFAGAGTPPENDVAAVKDLSSALQEQSPVKRAEIALAVLKNAPSDKSALQLFSASISELPPKSPEFRRLTLALLDLSAARPDKLELAVAAWECAQNAKISRAVRLKHLSTVVHARTDLTANAAKLLTLVYAGELAADYQFEEGVELCEKLLEANPDDATLSFAALKYFNVAAKRANTARRWLGMGQSRREEYAAKEQSLLERLEASPDADKKVQLIDYYLQNNQKAKALELLKPRLEQEKKAPLETDLVMMRFHIAAGDHQTAADIAEAILCKYPHKLSSQVAPSLCEVFQRANRDEKAVISADLALANPKNDTILPSFLKGLSLIRLRRFGEIAPLLGVLPDSLRLNLQVLSLVSQDKNNEAVELLDEYEAKNPKACGDDFYNLYLLPAEHGRLSEPLQKAMEYYCNKGLLSDARHANDIAYLLASLELQLEEAANLAQTAVAEEPSNASLLDTFAFVKFKQGELKEARKYMERAIDNLKTSDDDDARYVLYRHAGDIEKALGNLEKAQEYHAQAERYFTSPWILRSPSK